MALRTLRRQFVAMAVGLSMTAAAASAQNAGIDFNSDVTNTPAVGRNCPAIQDAAYVVDPVAPTPVFLPVTNAENATVSIYQYPVGGDVIFAGPSQLDYLFVPDNSFDGRATLRYRVTPKGDCNGDTFVGSVTLVGGRVAADGLPGFHQHACGIGASHVLMMASAGAMLVFAVQRRRPYQPKRSN